VDHNGKGCRGCGRQEQFYGCSDIAVGTNTEFVPYVPPPTTTAITATIIGTPDAKDRAILDLLFGNKNKLSSHDNNLDFSSAEWLEGHLDFDTSENTTHTPSTAKEAIPSPSVSTKESPPREEKQYDYGKVISHREQGVLDDLRSLGFVAPDMEVPDYPDDTFDDVGSSLYKDMDYYGMDDYEYVNIIKSVIGMLQNKLKKTTRAKSSLPFLGSPILTEPFNIPQKLIINKYNRTTNNTRAFDNDSINYTGDTIINMDDSMDGSGSDAIYSQEIWSSNTVHSEDSSTNYERDSMQEQMAFTGKLLHRLTKNSTDSSSLCVQNIDKGKSKMCRIKNQEKLERIKPAPTRKYTLLEVLKLSSKTATVKP
jgi:hypothetical protein